MRLLITELLGAHIKRCAKAIGETSLVTSCDKCALACTYKSHMRNKCIDVV